MKKHIGLKRGVVKLKQHNLNWKKLFEKERKILLKKFPNLILEISYGGSTVIPGIAAKPIIDMFATISSLKKVKNEKIKKEFENIGYEYRGEQGVKERILYVKGKPELRTHHLQFAQEGSNEWKNHLLIREYFLINPDEAKKYEALKIKLAKQYSNDRKKYTHGKDKFIKSIIKKAKHEK